MTNQFSWLTLQRLLHLSESATSLSDIAKGQDRIILRRKQLLIKNTMGIILPWFHAESAGHVLSGWNSKI